MARAPLPDDRYTRYRDAIAGRRLPLALCDLHALHANLEALRARAAHPIRIATKSVRCVEILRRVLREPGYSGLMAFTPAEAAFLAGHGFDDILIAYPNVDPHELDAALGAVRSGTTLVFMVDAPAHVQCVADRARELGVRAELCLDVDLSVSFPGLHFGVRRSPIRDVQSAVALGELVRRTPSVELVGVMGYEAQIAGLADDAGNVVRSAAIRALKAASLTPIRRRRGAVVRALREQGHAIRFVNGGGTGSLESTSADPSVTELAAGSGIYAPTLFDGYATFRHQPALCFALPVVRHPAPGIVTCLGGGYVASGATGPDRLPTPWLPAGLSLLDQEGAGEVQTPLSVPKHVELPIGAPVFFRHAKAGELAERFDSLVLVQGGEVVGEVPTYRGEGQSFL